MNLEPLTQIKTANAEEHLKVVLKDVDIANSELNKVLELIKTAKESLAHYDKELLAKTNAYVGVCRDTFEKVREAEVATTSLLKLSEEVEQKLLDVNREVETKKKIIVDLDNKYNRMLIQHRETMGNFEKQLKELGINVSKLEKLQSDLLNSIGVSNKDLQKLENEISQKKETKELLEQEFNRFVISSKKEREEIATLIEIERQKIARPMKLLEETMTVVQNKERNVNVLIRRFNKAWNREHPDRPSGI